MNYQKNVFSLFLLLILTLLMESCGCQENTTTIIYAVRHADKVGNSDQLSEKGIKRSQDLLHLLSETGIDVIYSSPYNRTKNTAQPLADALNLEVTEYDPSKLEELIAEIKANHLGKKVLVVGHSNTTPSVVNLLKGDSELPNISESEYDHFYTILLDCCGSRFIKMEYGEVSPQLGEKIE